MITAQMVKELREKTQAGLMDCKEALSATNGNFEEAEVWLRKKNLDRGSKQDKPAAEGGIAIASSQTSVAMIEMTANTDFVVRSDDFNDLASGVSVAVNLAKANTVEEALALNYKDGKTIGEMIQEVAGLLKENVSLKRVIRFESPNVGFYLHSDGKQAAMVEVENAPAGEADKIGKDVSMHIVFAKPKYLTRDEVPVDEINRERIIISGIVASDPKYKGKPEAIMEKIVTGQMNAFFAESVLLDQGYYREQKKSVATILKDVRVKRFAHFEVGAK